ncbi:hypothetical protein D3C71_2104620 [compost metagenome]
MNQHTATSRPITANTTAMPSWKKPAQRMPRATQNAIRKALDDTLRMIAEPRMTMAVSARPTMPENIGVRPENSM